MTDQDAPAEPAAGKYPASWEFDGLLTDGRAVCVRPVQPADAPRLISFHRGLSSPTIYRRYFGAHPDLTPEEARRGAELDYHDRMGFLAIVGEEIVGFANYERLAPEGSSAEVAFVVADKVQRHGVATLLFETLVAYARGVGISRFVAEVLDGNAEMLGVFQMTGLALQRIEEAGTIRVDIDLQPTAAYVTRCDDREATAEAASIAAVLRPRSVAVVGAGRRPGNAGHELVRALLAGDFAGTVYPVNPHATAVSGAPAFRCLSALPEVPDLAIVAVPSAGVRDVVEEAATIGVRSVVIITAGFGEMGQAGASVESEMLGIARRAGMRIVGPNCLGVVNTDPLVRMDATFAALHLDPGRLALISQSGALGVALAHEAGRAGLGLSVFASIGNKLDVSSNDLLCFLERDERTAVIALYLESFGNPRKFARIARRIGASKPIVALKAGRSSSGARGARSHTAAAATPDVVVSALLRDAGVIKVERLEELLDVSSILLTERVPSGRRVALVGNSGGPMILAADACESNGLGVLEFSAERQGELAATLSASAALSNPVDLTADGTYEQLRAALQTVCRDEAVDAVMVVVTALPALSLADTRAVIAETAASSPKPIVACLLGGEANDSSQDRFAEIPSPERAASALGYVARYGRWRDDQGKDTRSKPTLRAATISDPVVAAILAAHPEGGWLELDEGARLLQTCGLPVLRTVGVGSGEEAAAAAASLGYPVVLKARAGEIVHKSDVGGVVLGLSNATEVQRAYEQMSKRIGPQMGGAVLQATAPKGVEAIVGVVSDPTFGPVVMVGLGGVATDLLGDRAFGVPPIGRADAEELLSSLRTAPLLDGYRGAPVVDRGALIELIEIVADLADQLPELVELDCNPVMVTTEGLSILDCKVRLGPSQLGPGPLFRALRARR